MTPASIAGPGPRTLVRIGLAAVLVVAGCATPPPSFSPAPTPTAPPTPAPTPTTTPSPRPTPIAAASDVPAPAGMVWVEIPEAGIMVPVPASWEQVPPADLTDPDRRADLERRFPGTSTLMQQADRLGDRAAPALLAVDPSEASRSGAFATNLSVLATEPSVDGFLLDLAAGFIADGIAETLGAPSPPRERVDLPAGEAIRLSFDVPPDEAGEPMTAIAWVIGAPGATVLLTMMGSEAALASIQPDEIAEAILPLAAEVP